MAKVESRGLRFEATEQEFTLLLRQHDGFKVMLMVCFLLFLSTIELEDLTFTTAHQQIVCEQAHDLCTYQQLQIHPFLFWKTGRQSFAIDSIDNSSYTADYEWEIELVDGRSFTLGGGRKGKLASQGMELFLAGERAIFQASENHPFIAVFQILLWVTLLFPFYILLLDLSAKPRSTQSAYVNGQVMILKKYNFSGHLHQESLPTATFKRLEVKKIKKEKKRYVFSLIVHTQTRKATVLYQAGPGVISPQNPLNAEAKMQELALSLQGFLKDQGIAVRVS
jgi:hypothetical protein